MRLEGLQTDEPIPDPWEGAANTIRDELEERGAKRAARASLRLGIRDWIELVPEERGPLDLVKYAFQIEPLYSERAITDTEQVHVKATQIGWSTGAIRQALYHADVLGRSVLYTFPTDDELKDFSRKRIRPVMRGSDHLRSRMTSDAVDNVGQKQIGQGWISFRGLSKPVDSIDVDVLIIDEYDTSDQGAIDATEYRLSGAESADIRRRIGVPSIPGFGIDAFYEASDQRVWTVKCEACNHHNLLKGFEAFSQNVDQDAVALVCAKCRRVIDVRVGEWVAKYPDRGIRGYHAPKLLVPGRRVLERVIANSKKTRPSQVEAFHQRDLGEAYAPAEGRLSLAAVKACVRPELRLEESLISYNLTTMGCCVPGTPITMADGCTRPIEDLTVGDRVRTRPGSVANVTTTMRRPYIGTVYAMRIYGQAEPLELTGEHPVWTERGWVQAENLRVGDRVLTPAFHSEQPQPSVLPPNRLRATEHATRDAHMAVLVSGGMTQREIGLRHGVSQAAVSEALKRRRRREATEPSAPLDLEALATVLGYYLAEGSVSRSMRRQHGQPSATVWDFHPDEQTLMEDLAGAVGRLGYRLGRPYVRQRDAGGLAPNGGQSCSVACGSPRLTELLLRLGGRGAAGKVLAEEVLAWPVVAQRRMLMAYLDGDGCWESPKPHLRRVQAGTASIHLAQQLHAIAVRCGIRMTPPRRQHSPSAQRVNARPKWVLQASFAEGDLIAGRAAEPRENRRSQITPDGLWRRIDAITERPYEGEVFNLDVDGDDTYLAAYVAVHNCDMASARALNVVIEEEVDRENQVGRKVWVGTVEDEPGGMTAFQRLCWLMETFQINMAGIDNEPDGRFAKAFAARFPGRVYRMDFFSPQAGARKEPPVWNVNDEEQFCSMWRTKAYDATFERFRMQRVLLPPLEMLDEDYPKHLGNLYRRKVELPGDTGKIRVDYVRTGPEDYAQCEAYNLAAIELYWRNAGIQSFRGQGPTPLTDEIEDFVASDLSSYGDEGTQYRPGFE